MNYSPNFVIDFVCVTQLLYTGILNKTGREWKHVFKPKSLLAFLSWWGSDIYWYTIDSRRMWKAALNQYSKPQSFLQVEVTTCLLRHHKDLCTVSRKPFVKIKAAVQFQSYKEVRGDSFAMPVKYCYLQRTETIYCAFQGELG